MVRVKSQAEIQANYTGSIGQAGARYKVGVQNATGVISASIAAEDIWAQRVQEAAARRARAKGLSKVSDEEWRAKASNLGAARIGPGMQANAAKQAANFEPFRQALSSLTLSPRTADPVSNVQRVVEVVNTMVATKKSQ